MKKFVKIDNKRIIVKFPSVGSIISAKTNQTEILAIPYLIGARISNENMEKIKESFENFIN